MKDILFLTTQFPYPLDNGGKIGAFNGLSVISKDNRVTVLSFSEDMSCFLEGKQYYEKILPNVTFVKPIKKDVHIRKKPLKLAKAIFMGTITDMPYAVSKFRNNRMIRTIDQIIKNRHWNLVFIDYLNMCEYGKYIRDYYKDSFDYYIFKDHNKEFELVEQEAKKYFGIRKKILTADSKRTLKFEIKEIQAADLVYSVCEENTDFLRKYNHNSYSMLPTYETNKFDESIRIFKNTYKILYIGGLSWQANLDGLKWFVEAVFPIVKKKIPQASLTVVGGGLECNPFEGESGVEYLGYVKDISGIYDDKMVFIVPLFEGSGIRIKILDAFDNQIPVVSTSIGCNTIGATNCEHLIVANDKYEFAEGVIRLLHDENLNYEIRRSAKEFLISKFSLTKRQEEFENEVQRLYDK